MKLTRYDNAAEFLKRARAPLEEQEAANNLIIGVPARVTERPGFYGDFPVYLATVDKGAELVAAAACTPPHNLIVYSARGADPEPLTLILQDALAFYSDLPSDNPARRTPGIVANGDTALAFAQLWTQQTGQPYKLAMNQRIYELRAVTPPANVPGHMRQARDEDIDLLAEWTFMFNVDCHLPTIARDEARATAYRYLDRGAAYLWELEGQPVSMAGRGRNSSHGITVGLVYTPPELRGRGYASACVATLSQQLLDAGWDFCTLYTDLANPTSNDIYQRIGYRPVCDSTEYHFVSE